MIKFNQDVYVVGVGLHPFSRRHVNQRTLAFTAASAALKDANLRFHDVGYVFNGYHTSLPMDGVRFLKDLGLTGVSVVHVENASATGSSAFREAVLRVASGQVNVAMALAFDDMNHLPNVMGMDMESVLLPAAFFGLWGTRRMHENGTTKETYAKIAAKNWNNARLNPYAQRQADHEVTVEEVLASKKIAEPFTSMMGCAVGCGGGCAIVANYEVASRVAKEQGRPMIKVASSAMESERYTQGHVFLGAVVGPAEMTRATARLAYEQSGFGPSDLNLVHVHDAFPVEELMYYELLGICGDGEGDRLVWDGDTEMTGRVPFSTDGGLIARGHPGAPTGIAQVHEIVTQLRGEAGKRQLPKPRVGMAHMVGGGSVCIRHNVERLRRRRRTARWGPEMELSMWREADAFRQEVRQLLEEHLPARLRGLNDGTGFPVREVALEWQQILHEQGWGVPYWPRECGGLGLTPLQRLIFEEECALAEAPTPNIQATTLVGPVLNEFGTPEQRARLIPPIVEGRAYWCQGFSEPGSGSDLASLRTRARREGDHYVINGQKIWTSHAHFADWVFMLVRTGDGASKHEGISFILVDMHSPGVTVRPIVDISGTHHLNETFYDEVKVPVENLVGQEGQGWSIAKFLLGNERVFGSVKLAGLKKDVARLRKLAGKADACGKRLADDEAFLERLTVIEMNVSTIEWMMYRAVSEGAASTSGWDMASILKVKASEVYQQVNALLFDAMGDRGPLLYSTVPALEDPPWAHPGMTSDLWRVGSELMFRRAGSIYGGTSEIQRNLISRSILSTR